MSSTQKGSTPSCTLLPSRMSTTPSVIPSTSPKPTSWAHTCCAKRRSSPTCACSCTCLPTRCMERFSRAGTMPTRRRSLSPQTRTRPPRRVQSLLSRVTSDHFTYRSLSPEVTMCTGPDSTQKKSSLSSSIYSSAESLCLCTATAVIHATFCMWRTVRAPSTSSCTKALLARCTTLERSQKYPTTKSRLTCFQFSSSPTRRRRW
mmetsp:Transcript_36093/g.90573  ORF Transcript_36093/g.90573 Transcript_36093/m.90573 type:complete len:204 (+) Transcript_36093:439-1050(+)